MLAKYKFKEFDLKSFLDFIKDLISLYEMGEIRFYPHRGENLFDKFQLEHIAPDWDVNHPKGFLYVWGKNIDKVRIISFDLFRKIGVPKIKMTVSLDNKIIILDDAKNITSEQVEASLQKFFQIESINIKQDEFVNVWWKYTHPAWWIWSILLFIFRDGIWNLLKLAWKHKLISGIILLILLPLIVQLLANYLTHKFGWN